MGAGSTAFEMTPCMVGSVAQLGGLLRPICLDTVCSRQRLVSYRIDLIRWANLPHPTVLRIAQRLSGLARIAIVLDLVISVVCSNMDASIDRAIVPNSLGDDLV